MIYEIPIDPVPKPRMVASDRYKKRPIVEKYWAFKKWFLLLCNRRGLTDLPASIGITFIMAMPESWSEKKKKNYYGSPHQQRPDLDNLVKAVKDCLCKDDSHIWRYTYMEKKWGREGKIIIEF